MANVYKIGTVSQRTGLAVATLRAWESQHGLLAPQRTPGGTRLYSEDDVERARYIRMLVHERGYSLNAVSTILEELAANSAPQSDADAVLRRLVRADPGWQGVVTFIEGVKALTGSAIAALGIYVRRRQTIFVPITVMAGRARRVESSSIALAEIPEPWQEAITALQPCSDPDLSCVPLRGSLAAWVREHRTRSFYAEPLTIGRRLLGVLMIGSPTAAGISARARDRCARLAVSAGPPLSLFAGQF